MSFADTSLPIPSLDQIFGPLGALALALTILIIGGRVLWWFIQDLAKQRDLAQAGWRDQTAATKAVAEAVEKRNQLEAERMKVEEAEQRGARRPRSRGGAQ